MYNSLIYSEQLFTKIWQYQNLFISLSIIKIKNMRQTEQKALDYLKSNPIVANFIKKVNAERKKYYKKINLSSKEPDLIVEIGNKFIRLWQGTSCWGFISRVDGDL